MAHKHSVYDTDAHFSINPFTRAIKNESASKVAVIQHDHNSERFTFKIPRLVDGHDMSVCDRVEVHYINMDSTNPENISADIYEVNDLQVSPDDSGFVICSWLLSQNATKYAGSLNFLVRFVCLDEGKVAYAWHTAVFTGISVSSGILNNAEEIIEPFPDVLAQWKADLFGVGDTQEQRLLTVSAEQQAAIAAKGAAVLDSIPDEYEALSALADQNHRNKAGAIVLDAEGESIVVNDASDFHMMGLKLFGKSTQDGTPTPDAPVDIVSVENPALILHGKNFANADAMVRNGFMTKEGEVFTLVKGEYRFSSTQNCYIPANTPICFHAEKIEYTGTADFWMGINMTFEDGTSGTVGLYVNGTAHSTRTYTKPVRKIGLFMSPNDEDGSTVQFKNLQIEMGSIPTEYEPHIETQTVETSHTLPGIPVSSGGNYTDANGQQWICDEVDLKRGVYVQRINRYTVNGNDTETWKISSLQSVEGATRFDMYIIGLRAGQQACLCSHYPGTEKANKYPETCWCNSTGNASYFEFRIVTARATTIDEIKALVQANPVDVVYALYTPIETPLSDAEINAFKALHSNKPNTTILNDAGAYIAVEYVADTKTYIDRKISEILKGSEQA